MEGVIQITGKTILNVQKLTIEGINPDRVQFVVREFRDPEGGVYEIEHVPTKTKTRGWTSNGLGSLMSRCADEITVRGELGND